MEKESNWKRLYGRKQAFDQRCESEISVSDLSQQLLEHLQDNQNSDSCAEALLGRRNAFIPSERMPVCGGNERNGELDDEKREDLDIASTVQRIVRERVEIESKADALRCHRTRKISRKDTMCGLAKQCVQRLQKRDQLSKSKPSNQTKHSPENDESEFLRKYAWACVRGEEMDIQERNAKDSDDLLYRINQRHEILQEKRRAHELHAKITNKALEDIDKRLKRSTSVRPQQLCDDGLYVQDKINRIRNDNQREAIILDRVHAKTRERSYFKRTFMLWKTLWWNIRAKRERLLQWNRKYQLRRALNKWLICPAPRSQSMEKRVTNKSLTRQASAHYRQKRLLLCFYTWMTYAKTQKTLKENAIISEKRKKLAVDFVKRHTQQQSLKLLDRSFKLRANVDQRRRRSTALLQIHTLPIQSASTPIPTNSMKEQPHKRIPRNRALAAMEYRAMERKARRECLQRKYKQIQIEKEMACIARQAEIEAQMEKQKQLEKAQRIHQKRLQRAKETELKQRMQERQAKRAMAIAFDRKRLLYYFGFHPLQYYYYRRKRIEMKAIRWHQLNVQFTGFQTWLLYRDMRRSYRKRFLAKQFQIAVRHAEITQFHRILDRWKSFMQSQRKLAQFVREFCARMVAHRYYKRWRNIFIEKQLQARMLETTLRKKLSLIQCRHILNQWKHFKTISLAEKQMAREKKVLWNKAQNWLKEMQ